MLRYEVCSVAMVAEAGERAKGEAADEATLATSPQVNCLTQPTPRAVTTELPGRATEKRCGGIFRGPHEGQSSRACCILAVAMSYIEIPVIAVKQGSYAFYVGVASAKQLLRIAYVRERKEGEGVQRILSAKRLKDIGAYVKGEKGPGLLPNSIILGLSKDARFDRKGRRLRIPDREREGFVIDGQHRLFAFQEQYVGSFDMPIPFTAFIGLDVTDVAYLFRTINSTQRKINPSLVYDLVPYLREREWAQFEDSRAQYLVQSLVEDRESPWYAAVAMLGGRDAPITQASFVTAIKVQLKRERVLTANFMRGAFSGQEIQYELLREYFQGIKDVFAREWLNPQYVVSKNLGVSASLNILGRIVEDISPEPEDHFDKDELRLTAGSFHPYLKKAKRAVTWERKEMGRTYLGAAGIRRLTDEILDAVNL